MEAFSKNRKSNKNKSDNFGVSVDMHENFILVGANNATGKSKQTGAVYLFELKQTSGNYFKNYLHQTDLQMTTLVSLSV